MKAKKIIFTTISLLCCLAAGTGIIAPSLSKAEADELPVIEKANSSLILPEGYENYLSLTDPGSISHNTDYFAVSNENKIYIYDKAKSEYHTYEHDCAVSQVSFAGDGKLYFNDSSNNMYRVDVHTLTSERVGLNCSTYVISGDKIYYATVSARKIIISRTDLSLSSTQVITSYNGATLPSLCIDGDKLYYVDGDAVKSDDGTLFPLPESSADTYSSAISGNIFFYVTSDGKLSAYDISSSSLLKQFDGDYRYVEYYDGIFYAVNKNFVETFDSITAEKKDYTIGSAFSAENRLAYASDSVFVGDELFISDKDNGKIIVYDTKKHTYRSVAADAPIEISSDGDTVLSNNGTNCTLYDLNGDVLFSLDASEGENFVSSTNVYGVYYTVTSSNSFGRIVKNSHGEYIYESVYKNLSAVSCELESDSDGFMYLYLKDRTVLRFTEASFIDKSDKGALCATFPVDISSFSVSYDGRCYGLSKNAIYTPDGAIAAVSDGGFVYGDASLPNSICIGYSSSELILLYSDYVISTAAVAVPNLNSLDSQKVSETVFSLQSSPLCAVKILGGSVVAEVDLSSLKESETFPYLKSYRIGETVNAVLLGSTDNYYLVCSYEKASGKYVSRLVSKNYCEIVDPSEISFDAADFPDGQAYTSSAVGVYKYPFVNDELSLVNLNRGDNVSVISRISMNNGEEYSYYYVSVRTAYGNISGYIPSTYLIKAEHSEEQPSEIISSGYIITEAETITLTADDGAIITLPSNTKFTFIGDPYSETRVKASYTDENGKTYYTDIDSSVFRTTNQRSIRTFVIILFVVIGAIIITDFLILRKKKSRDDDDEAFYSDNSD